MQRAIKGTTLRLVQGDITAQDVDAIVNAANSSLMGGGGVDGAIHRAGGPQIKAECKVIVAASGPLATGNAVITTGGNLRAKHVIHTVGPVWHGTGAAGEHGLLERCYRQSLGLAKKHGLRSIAFPSISTGAYRFPIDRAAFVALNGVVRWVVDNEGALDEVRFVLFSAGDFAVYEETFAEVMRTMIGTSL
ncbi:MAG: macro domain-containing protein [Myxococcales bacterium]